MSLLVLFVAYLVKTCGTELAVPQGPELHAESPAPVPLGPMLREEPPAVVVVSGAGERLRCLASGDPAPRISWLAADGSLLQDEPGVRRVLGDGSLQVWRVRGPQVLRCRAASMRGAVLSRPVTLQPVREGGWVAVVETGAAASGGVAVLRCLVPGTGPVRTASWYRAGATLDTKDPRYLEAGDTLLIRDVNAADAAPYSCTARALGEHASPVAHSLPTPLVLGVDSSGTAPRLPAAAVELTATNGDRFCLPCAAPSFPVPHYTWYRELEGRLQPMQISEEAAGSTGWDAGGNGLRAWAGGAALCGRAALELAGAWLCKAYNDFGDATLQLRLHVDADLDVTVTPAVTVAAAGDVVELSCRSSVPAALSWRHDGAPLAATGARLMLRDVSRAHAGMYQCEATRGRRTELATAELRLADSAPELQYTFIEQALRVGAAAALRCSAAATPAPTVSWLLDGEPLERFLPRHRYRVTEEASPPSKVTSLLNVTVSAADGGLYTCRAHNALGAVEHSARLDVYGPPAVRALSPLLAVAGDNVTLYCPYSGYPIRSVWWRRGGTAVPTRGRVAARGAALLLRPVQARDTGRYTCEVAAPVGATVSGDLDLQVLNPPKISPFIFSSELTEGSAVQVLCGVSEGDKPLYFSWLKDGRPVPAGLQIEEKSLNEFSLLMFPELTARHSGAYTCRVSNHAAVANYTATLSVRVASSWVTEPVDVAVVRGAPLRLECAARGHPTPAVTWYRRQGDGAEVAEHWEATGAAWDAGGARDEDVAAELGVSRAWLAVAGATRVVQGAYRCTADNGVGSPLLKQVNVTVHEPAHFAEAETVLRNASCVLGASVTLACEARGDAPLTVHWTHRGVNIDRVSFRWTVSEARNEGEGTAGGVRSTLHLRAANRDDAGEYRCRAHNRFGSSDRIIFLHVEEPPEAPRSVELARTSSSWIRVRWRARQAAGVRYWAECAPLGADAVQPLNLTLNPEEEGGPDSQGYRALSATVSGVRPAVAYVVRVLAANRVGRSPRSESLLVTTLEEVPSAPPQSVHVKPVGTRELHVSWSAPAQHTWNGELVGYAVSWREVSRRESASDGGLRVGQDVVRGWGATELRLRGLREFARFAVTVKAFNAAGAGPPSPVLYAVTADGVPETAPGDVRCAAEGVRALRVRWSPPSAPAPTSVAPLLYDVLYAPMLDSPTWSGAGAELSLSGVDGAARESLLSGLRAHTNYTVRLRARSTRGAGPASEPSYCSTHDDVPGAVETLRAVAVAESAVRVSWMPPAGVLTHYTLHIRELGKVGGEWSQRIEITTMSKSAGDRGEREEKEECSALVTGLRPRTAFEFRVSANTAAGAGPRSRAAAATTPPTDVPVSARIWSLEREVWARAGGRVRLRCAMAGEAPLVRRWAPLPRAHSVTDTGDLLLHKVESDGNYTCSVRNAAGWDSVVLALRVRRPPEPPAPRLLGADTHALHLAWDEPAYSRDPVLGYSVCNAGYSVWWRRSWKGATGEAAQSTRTTRRELVLRGLACGAHYAVWLHAHNLLGASPPSHTLTLRTKGHKAKAPLAKEFIWANSSALRLNLLAWGGGCAATRWALVVGTANVPADGETATASNLEPGTWYEIRVTAFSPAGDTTAFYRASTLTINGERIGAPSEVPAQTGTSAADGGVRRDAGWKEAWRGAAAAGLCATSLALLVAAAALGATRRRRSPDPANHIDPPLKKLPPPDDELQEISPYATFNMASAAGSGARSCELRLHVPARAEPLAAPPRQRLAHSTEYCSESESSGSPCAACTAELYRVPAARLAETLPAAVRRPEERRASRRGTRCSEPALAASPRSPPASTLRAHRAVP